VYRVLRAMEDSGRCRRGYVVEGLGAAQFAVPGAIDRVRAMSRPDGPQSGAMPFDDVPASVRAGSTPGGAGSSSTSGGSAPTDAGGPSPGFGPATGDRTASGFGRAYGAVDDGPSRVVLAAADPAQPYGAALPWPDTVGDTAHRPGRKAGALVVLVDGAPVLYVERGGRSLLSFPADREELQAAAEALAGVVHEGWLGTLAVERADGVDSLGSAMAEVLTEAGFRVTPKGLRLRA
jgi:ATP-dependent helicase Lhr and Lhr-like helicase